LLTQADSNNYALDNLLVELSLIKDLSIRNFTTSVILKTPGLFWYRPSAYFRGHHPDDEYKEWGNLLHVKRVLVIAREFAGIEDLGTASSDTLYSGLLVHDIGKYGPDGLEERIQLKTHAEIAVNFILAHLESEATPAQEQILGIVMSHMGRWGDFKPSTPLEKLGSYCDCIASRANINIPVKLK
jgi:23S rRNA maturation-related 3'-5' exoribonuclease YhaM